MSLALAAAPASAIDGSALQKGPGGFWHIVMPSDLVQSMRDSVPRFTMFADSQYAAPLRAKYPYGEHASPFALIHDLNEDAREDVVFDGQEGEDRVVYLAVSAEREYRWIEVVRRSLVTPAARDTGLFWQALGGLPGEHQFNLRSAPSRDSESTSGYVWTESHGLGMSVQFKCGFPVGPVSKE